MTTATRTEAAPIIGLVARAVELSAELEAKIEETAEAFNAAGEEAARIYESSGKGLGLIWGTVLNSTVALASDARGDGGSAFDAEVLREDAGELSELVRFAVERDGVTA